MDKHFRELYAQQNPEFKNPRVFAQAILAERQSDIPATFSKIDIAGPGFINLHIASQLLRAKLKEACKAKTRYGHTKKQNPRKIIFEFVSANPTGPLHVGHTRGAVFGDALASLLDFSGYKVTREYVINDGGSQIDTLARSVYLRYLEAHGQEVSFPDGVYPGDYLIPVGQALKDEVGDKYVDQPEDVWLEELRNFGTERMMDLIRADMAALGVRMDVFFSEKSLYGTGRIEECLETLDKKGLIYQGTLPPPKGKELTDWEPREQTLFRSTDHGDDVDRPVRKSDGTWTYFAPDIAYHYDKVQRGFDELIDVFGADHGGYVKRMKAAVSALSDGQVPLDIKLCQLVRLFKDGEPFKMSKRAGTFVMLRDLIDLVGADVTRFVMLTRKNDAPLDFDFSKALEQSKDNPVFYVQYAHARICSVLRKAQAAGIPVDDTALKGADLSLVAHEAELAVAKKLAEWPRLVEIAARTNEPHRVAFYLYELAGEFHALWNRGNDLPELRFLQEGDISTSQAKIALIRAVSIVISAGLSILGVTPAKEMR
jgi:arginyl-tRNA synthetase